MNLNDKRKGLKIDGMFLVRILGLRPLETTNVDLINELSTSELRKLYWYAKINKIGFTYLKALEKADVLKRIPELKKELEVQEKMYEKHNESIEIISNILTDLGVDHVFIKTIYDFPMLPSDIDILIYGETLENVASALIKKGLKIFDKGPHFISIYNTIVDASAQRPKMSYDIDIYDEISLSYFKYMDKSLCSSDRYKYSSGVEVLSAECELLIHINHSLFEHLFTLSHLYVISTLLPRINFHKLEILSNLAESRVPLALVSEIVNKVLKSYQDGMPTPLVKFVRSYQNKKYTTIRVSQLPYRYSLKHVAEAIIEKVRKKYYLLSMLEFTHAFRSQEELNHIMFHIILRRKRITY
jgi:hypothetical protein